MQSLFVNRSKVHEKYFTPPIFSTRSAVLILLDLLTTLLFSEFVVFVSPYFGNKFCQFNPPLSYTIPPSGDPVVSCDGRVGGVAAARTGAVFGATADWRGKHRCLFRECSATGGGRRRCWYFGYLVHVCCLTRLWSVLFTMCGFLFKALVGHFVFRTWLTWLFPSELFNHDSWLFCWYSLAGSCRCFHNNKRTL